ncbi:MAG: hypothetical protein AW07_02072 [Candidatus Accumulibacter sp. SK-11]|nr:MAG: hypothetical protein AW07_02072 [Candidatus Accumulibacter sp. SK-11]
MLLAAQPGIDVARGLFAMADADRDVAFRRHHVATREDARMAGHHVGCHLHDSVAHLQAGNALEKAEVDVLTEREHQGVGFDGFELAGRLGKAFAVEGHLFDGQR